MTRILSAIETLAELCAVGVFVTALAIWLAHFGG